jgi:hypothetical protein
MRVTFSKDVIATLSSSGIKSLFYDGRKYKTIRETTVGCKGYVMEEHVTLLEEPNCNFLGHISPSTGSSQSIKDAIIQFFQGNQISLENVVAIGFGGTNVNTSVRNGVIRLLELHLGRPAQWSICMYHFNELPLRHLLIHIDGTT